MEEQEAMPTIVDSMGLITTDWNLTPKLRWEPPQCWENINPTKMQTNIHSHSRVSRFALNLNVIP